MSRENKAHRLVNRPAKVMVVFAFALLTFIAMVMYDVAGVGSFVVTCVALTVILLSHFAP